MKQNEQVQKPFFAKFLETQQSTKETTNEGRQTAQEAVTKPIFDTEHTLKFPSDSDEDIF